VGRPRKALLDRDRIAATAMELVDEYGDFTVPELARRLGVQTASVYHHVDGRTGIVELLRVRIGEAIDYAPLELRPWDVALEAFMRSYRAAFAAHPRLVPLLATTPIRDAGILAAYERIVAVLDDAGFPAPVIMTALTALENLVLGSALDLAAPEVMWEVPPEVDAPRLTAALAAQPPGTGRADQAFDFGLAALMTGLRDLLSRTGGSG
jgi:AcrR family transcriptional regulator